MNDVRPLPAFRARLRTALLTGGVLPATPALGGAGAALGGPRPASAAGWPAFRAVARDAASEALVGTAGDFAAPFDVGGHPGGAPAGDPDVVENVRLAQDGSAQAFALLYDRYVDQVYAYVYHRVGQRQTAEDLVGDVFLKALQNISTFRWRGVDFGAWLITIARNRVHDHFKSARFRLESTVGEVYDSPSRSSHGSPEDTVLSNEVRRQVHEGLRQLKGEQAEVLYLRFIQHLDVSQAAAVMGKTEGAIKALQYRALRSLAKIVPAAAEAH